jgi:hypothetical protein
MSQELIKFRKELEEKNKPISETKKKLQAVQVQ